MITGPYSEPEIPNTAHIEVPSPRLVYYVYIRARKMEYSPVFRNCLAQRGRGREAASRLSLASSLRSLQVAFAHFGYRPHVFRYTNIYYAGTLRYEEHSDLCSINGGCIFRNFTLWFPFRFLYIKSEPLCWRTKGKGAG